MTRCPSCGAELGDLVPARRGPDAERREAAELFLKQVLRGTHPGGPREPLESTDVMAMAERAGITPRTLRRARATLGVVTNRGDGGRWTVHLPKPAPESEAHE